jgi:hypothetical protein
MKELIDKFITPEDEHLISEITGTDFKELCYTPEWDEYNNKTKHVCSSHDVIGMHLLRCVLAERIHDYKRSLLGTLDYPEYKEFLENGIYVWENFGPKDYDKFQILMTFITARTNINFKPPWQSRTDKHVEFDLQYTCHVDTFHPAFKVFGYLNDITKEHGPYAYVKGTHKNTPEKLRWLYDASVNRTKQVMYNGLTRESNIERWNDSFRLMTEKDYCIDSEGINEYLSKYNLPNETLVTGKTNTIIITDTSGLHRKYPATPGYTRHSSRCVVDRQNPFQL